MKIGLGYQNLKRLKKATTTQPKIYNANSLNNNKLKIDLPAYEETLEDTKESKLKMKDKMIPLDYTTLNKLYVSFVPQTEISAEQTYLSPPSTSNTRYNKTPYELINGRNLIFQYFYVFGCLCYPTNDHDNLGKMKPKADIGIFIGYSESSRGFQIYNHRTRKIMKTIHVKFDELTAMASECNNSGSEYYETRTPEVSNSFVANTLNNKDTPSSSSIIVEEHEGPQLVSSSEEPIANEPTTPVSNNN
nr:retrovirus-related Pol polyprotein from transposon TNT 1-94 [Tanacetum cinerariifolium]